MSLIDQMPKDVEARHFRGILGQLDEEISDLEVEARLLRDESTEKYERLENLDREGELIRARIERLERDPETD